MSCLIKKQTLKLRALVLVNPVSKTPPIKYLSSSHLNSALDSIFQFNQRWFRALERPITGPTVGKSHSCTLMTTRLISNCLITFVICHLLRSFKQTAGNANDVILEMQFNFSKFANLRNFTILHTILRNYNLMLYCNGDSCVDVSTVQTIILFYYKDNSFLLKITRFF